MRRPCRSRATRRRGRHDGRARRLRPDADAQRRRHAAACAGVAPVAVGPVPHGDSRRRFRLGRWDARVAGEAMPTDSSRSRATSSITEPRGTSAWKPAAEHTSCCSSRMPSRRQPTGWNGSWRHCGQRRRARRARLPFAPAGCDLRPADSGADAPGVVRAYLARYAACGSVPKRQAIAGRDAYEALSPVERLALCTFDNVCSCIRRYVWERHPFQLGAIAEDLHGPGRCCSPATTLAYVPDAVVVHSHDRSAVLRTPPHLPRAPAAEAAVRARPPCRRAGAPRAGDRRVHGRSCADGRWAGPAARCRRGCSWAARGPWPSPWRLPARASTSGPGPADRRPRTAPGTRRVMKRALLLVHGFPPEATGGTEIYAASLAQRFWTARPRRASHARAGPDQPEYRFSRDPRRPGSSRARQPHVPRRDVVRAHLSQRLDRRDCRRAARRGVAPDTRPRSAPDVPHHRHRSRVRGARHPGRPDAATTTG